MNKFKIRVLRKDWIEGEIPTGDQQLFGVLCEENEKEGFLQAARQILSDNEENFSLVVEDVTSELADEERIEKRKRAYAEESDALLLEIQADKLLGKDVSAKQLKFVNIQNEIKKRFPKK